MTREPEERPSDPTVESELDTVTERLRAAHGKGTFGPDGIAAACDGIVKVPPPGEDGDTPVIVRALMYELLRTKRIVLPPSVSDELYLVV